MKIDKVMIAGVDNDTPIEELERLTEKYPFVEWGVLFSKHKMGQKRYPDLNYIHQLCKAEVGLMSAHFCGAYPREILEKGDISEASHWGAYFESIQLNYNFSRSSKWSWENFHRITDELAVDVILQHNRSNAPYLKHKEFLTSNPHLRFLYDASGGRGTEIKHIENPLWNNYTGYAGGIHKDNVERLCKIIKKKPSLRTVWIDLESGARDENNRFSIKNAETILGRASKYVSEKS